MQRETTQLHVKGMYCSACVRRIEKSVENIEGVNDISINLALETGNVTYNKQRTSIAEIIDQIKQIGFEANVKRRNNKNQTSELKALQWKFICSAILTFPLAWAMLAHFEWISSLFIPPLFKNPFFQLIITFPIQFIIGFPFYERAWKAMKQKSANMDVLVVLSTSAAFFYSHYVTFKPPNDFFATESPVLFYETSAFIITFILLGRLLEEKTKSRTKEALEKLYQIQVKSATVMKEGQEVVKDIEHVRPQDIIIVKPGEKLPIDGKVTEGYSMVDESLLTGESIPVEKHIGSDVYAGTINQNGLIKIIVTKKESETALANIIHIVEDAQHSKAPIQHIADKIVNVFVPIIIIIALGTFIIWYFLLEPGVFDSALSKVIAVLIIACPCALGLATPTSIMVGSGRAAQRGILFKEGKYLELLQKSDYVLIDKTGTITTGLPEVTDIYVPYMDSQIFLQMIAAVEKASDHPIAKAIVEKSAIEGTRSSKTKYVQNIPGYGIQAEIDHHEVIIANSTYFLKHSFSVPNHALHQEQKLRKAGKSVMMVCMDRQFSGLVAVVDEIKSSAITAIIKLKEMGFKPILITGDHKKAGQAVARKIGVQQVYTECSPIDKAKLVEELQKRGHQPVMVGDGINDAPALATAEIGVAIGTGSDVAIESGNVTIIQGDLDHLVDAFRISHKTMINIKQNLAWAFLYNVIMIPFAVVGVLVPWLAGAAMAFSSISVVLNALRLKSVKI